MTTKLIQAYRQAPWRVQLQRLGYVALAILMVLLVAAPLTLLAAEDGAGKAHDPTLFQIIFSGGWVGATIMIAIFALSFAAAYLIFDQFMTLRRKAIMPEGLGDEVRKLLHEVDPKYWTARAACICYDPPPLSPPPAPAR